MFKNELFKEKILELKRSMKANLRGELKNEIEFSIIDELAEIYLKIVEKYSRDVELGSHFPAQPNIVAHPKEQQVFHALMDLLERMELDFSQKFVLDFTHDLKKEIEIGKIKIALLDSVRRILNFSNEA